MKVAITNFSGNTGKTTTAKHLFLPRMKDAIFIAVESINSDEGGDETVRGKQYGQLNEQLLMIDEAVIDVGASNVEDFFKLMQQYKGSHEDFDYFIVPAVKDSKQIKDTIATIEALSLMGIPSKKIRVVFNRLESDETVEDAFYPLFAYHEDKKAFTLRPKAVIHYSELYQKMRAYQTGIPELLADTTDYKAKMRETQDPAEKARAAAMISMRRLAGSAQDNLDAVYAALLK
ncbi:StbB family protein [Brucella cytisi]|uniref:Stability protein StdB n=1 Tax=Brucella cytisi TaxID=407152 RepID=A0A1J6HXV5_9HYPH|nr:StbB family protein [Brucella cytisi]OIS90318.1 hypothetical protein BLA27_27395 [Brucella cytisi]